jgi:hypothetical protein
MREMKELLIFSFSIRVNEEKNRDKHYHPVGTSKANGHDLVDANDKKGYC